MKGKRSRDVGAYVEVELRLATTDTTDLREVISRLKNNIHVATPAGFSWRIGRYVARVMTEKMAVEYGVDLPEEAKGGK